MRNPYKLTRDQNFVESQDNPKNIGISIDTNTGAIELTVDEESSTTFIAEQKLLEEHDNNTRAAQSEFLINKEAGVCVGSLQYFKKWRETPPHGHIKLSEKEVEDLMKLRGVSLSAHKHWPEHYKVSMIEARNIMSKRRK